MPEHFADLPSDSLRDESEPHGEQPEAEAATGELTVTADTKPRRDLTLLVLDSEFNLFGGSRPREGRPDTPQGMHRWGHQ